MSGAVPCGSRKRSQSDRTVSTTNVSQIAALGGSISQSSWSPEVMRPLHPFHGFDAEQAQAGAQDSGGHVTQDEAGVLHDAF
jgi:hypothetical protein